MGGADTVFPETAEKDGGGGPSAGESPGEIAAGGGREYGADVEENLGLVHAFAKRYAGRGVEYDDLYGAGCVGLVKAAKGFDPSRGCAFSTYAVPVIVGEMKRLFRDDGTVKVSRRLKELYLRINEESERYRAENGREPHLSYLAAALGEEESEIALAMQAACPPMSLSVSGDGESDTEVIDLPVCSPEDELVTRLELSRAMEALPEEDRALIRLRYMSELSQQKTADILGMTQVQVSRKEKRILMRLRELMK